MIRISPSFIQSLNKRLLRTVCGGCVLGGRHGEGTNWDCWLGLKSVVTEAGGSPCAARMHGRTLWTPKVAAIPKPERRGHLWRREQVLLALLLNSPRGLEQQASLVCLGCAAVPPGLFLHHHTYHRWDCGVDMEVVDLLLEPPNCPHNKPVCPTSCPHPVPGWSVCQSALAAPVCQAPSFWTPSCKSHAVATWAA